MGFGILFIGYLFLVEIPFLGGFDLGFIGYAIMLLGLGKLKDYEEGFSYARYPAVALLPLSLLLFILRLFFPEMLTEGLFAWLLPLRHALVLGFHLLLLLAMRRLCQAVEQPENAQKCLRNLIFVGIYFLGMFLLNLPIPAFRSYFSGQGRRWLLLFDVSWNLLLLLNSWRIFTCFRTICPEGEEDEP